MYEIKGTILFEPKHISKKHQAQGVWKRVAMVNIPGDVDAYYRWLINRRYGIVLNNPVRGAHITFINDKLDINNPHYKTYEQELKQFNKKEITVLLNPKVIRTDDIRWWIQAKSEELLDIREQLGFNRKPHYGLHLTIGNVHPKYQIQQEYIHNLIKLKKIL